MRNGDESRVFIDPFPRMYSVGLERWDDEPETVVVGDGDVCSIEDDEDDVDVLLSCCDEDDESFFSNCS